jgi:hypothetical protein
VAGAESGVKEAGVVRRRTSVLKWQIRVYDGTAVINEMELPATRFTIPRLKLLMQMLVAKYGLEPSEIADCLCGQRAHLYVRQQVNDLSRTVTLSCGGGVHCVARMVST